MSALDELFKWLKKTRGGNGVVIKAAEELAALRAENERLKADLHQQTHETVGAEMERDGYKKYCAIALMDLSRRGLEIIAGSAIEDGVFSGWEEIRAAALRGEA